MVLLVRQAPASAAATVARVDRAGEAMDRLSRLNARVGVVVVVGRPYDPGEVATTIGGELFGVLAEDPIGAESGRRGLDGRPWSGRSALLRSARRLPRRSPTPLTAPGRGCGGEPFGGCGMSIYEPIDRDGRRGAVVEQRTLVRTHR